MSYAIIKEDGSVFISTAPEPLPSFAPDSACGAAAALVLPSAETPAATTTDTTNTQSTGG